LEKEYLISIGITTYDRLNFLKILVGELIIQKQDNYEILIGNDFVEKKLTYEDLGINKASNIKIFNHSKNLGEYENLKFLFQNSSGDYFTWQFDDDCYSQNFLKFVRRSIINLRPDCIFCNYSFIYDDEKLDIKSVDKTPHAEKLSGAEFLKKFCKRLVPTMALTGVYKRSFIEKIGILPLATEGKYALYSEYLLLLKSINLESIIYCKEALVFSRIHSGSFSVNNDESNYFYKAGVGFMRQALYILKSQDDGFKEEILLYFLRAVIRTNCIKTKISFSGIVKLYQINDEVFHLIGNNLLNKRAVRLLFKIKIVLWIITSAIYPQKWLSYLHKLKTKSFLSKMLKPSF
jgi:glycosyltransferase involved in cell wall biosynthesis